MKTSPSAASRLPHASPRSKPPFGPAFAAALADWARTDGLTWIYLLKAVGAGLLALGIAMKLDLPQPRTAMTTVFIVMQRQSGMVFAKSTWRICGTLVGLVVMLALIGFPAAQHPDGAFLSAMTRVAEIVVGIVTSGLVSAVFFPEYTGEVMRTSVHRRFLAFVEHVVAALADTANRS
ncbi:MAG TPA: FUSC family protein, partial [Paraburkholderia sp.]